MRERPLSSSSIKTYLQCVLKYYYRYEDKKPRPGKTPALAFGIAVHAALEHLHKLISESSQPPTPEMYDDVISVFMSHAVSNGLDDMSIYQEGRDLITKRLDNIDPEEKVLGLELQFNLKTPKGTPFTGSIDKLVELDSDTVVIVDYKTSKVALTQEEADVDIQLSMYDLAVSMLFPQYKTIVCALDYLRLGDVITHRTKEQRKCFVDFLDTVYQQISTTGEDDVLPNLNSFCAWCEFKSYCPEYKKIIEDPNLILPPIGELSNDDFVDAWELTSASKRAIEDYQRSLKDHAYSTMRVADTIKGVEKELYKTQVSRVSYDPKAVFNIVGPEAFVKMASVSKAAVDKYLRDNPDKANDVDNTAAFSFAAPAFKTRKIKD